MDAQVAWHRFVWGLGMATVLFTGGIAVSAQQQEEDSTLRPPAEASPTRDALPPQVLTEQDALQPVYQGMQQAVSYYSHAVDATSKKLVSLLQDLARNEV
ncbi:MAG: hypothetical protein HY692_09900, partial [Cyanobacteria bacterium NC_groundwater_1444_Ag_S-0.65um_54_12]|nr:hypothetical protein [Cyanobacteria bacterium NC_groundwater_1444_Ag_S-0.65um_54_12]